MNTEARHLLFEKSRELFTRYGVKSLTMDDIARELGMSKKTIYRFISNKNELVKLAMAHHLEAEKKQVSEIMNTASDSVAGMLQILDYIVGELRELNPSILYDLQKYYPEAWAAMNQYRYDFILNTIMLNLERGKQEGVYRKDFDSAIIARIYVKGMDLLMDQQLFPQKQFNFINIYTEFIKYHLRGIVSPKGLMHLDTLNP